MVSPAVTGRRRHDLVGTSGRVGALAPARHARRVRLTDKVFFPPRGVFSAVRSKTLKKKKRQRSFSKFWAGLGSETSTLLHRWRKRCSRLPTTRPTARGLQEPICPRKKCVIWTRWCLVSVKYVNYPRAPSSRRSGLVGPHTTPTIVNYEYMPSTL